MPAPAPVDLFFQMQSDDRYEKDVVDKMMPNIYKPLKRLGQFSCVFINTGINPGVSKTNIIHHNCFNSLKTDYEIE